MPTATHSWETNAKVVLAAVDQKVLQHHAFEKKACMAS
jgi:hypothetical protein